MSCKNSFGPLNNPKLLQRGLKGCIQTWGLGSTSRFLTSDVMRRDSVWQIEFSTSISKAQKHRSIRGQVATCCVQASKLRCLLWGSLALHQAPTCLCGWFRGSQPQVAWLWRMFGRSKNPIVIRVLGCTIWAAVYRVELWQVSVDTVDSKGENQARWLSISPMWTKYGASEVFQNEHCRDEAPHLLGHFLDHSAPKCLHICIADWNKISKNALWWLLLGGYTLPALLCIVIISVYSLYWWQQQHQLLIIIHHPWPSIQHHSFYLDRSGLPFEAWKEAGGKGCWNLISRCPRDHGFWNSRSNPALTSERITSGGAWPSWWSKVCFLKRPQATVHTAAGR